MRADRPESRSSIEPAEERAERVVIGEIVAPFGHRGEVKVYPHTDVPERLVRMKEVALVGPDGAERRYPIVRSRLHKNVAIMQLEGVADMNAAEALRGFKAVVAREERAPLPKDTFYMDDLAGLQVRTEEGRILGEIVQVLKTPANDVYDLGNLLIPAIKDVVVRVDLEAGTMTIRPIPGLLDEPETA
jgi:16S rRNA processing protein RimM